MQEKVDFRIQQAQWNAEWREELEEGLEKSKQREQECQKKQAVMQQEVKKAKSRERELEEKTYKSDAALREREKRLEAATAEKELWQRECDRLRNMAGTTDDPAVEKQERQRLSSELMKTMKENRILQKELDQLNARACPLRRRSKACQSVYP